MFPKNPFTNMQNPAAHSAAKSVVNPLARFKYELGVVKSFLTNSASKKFITIDFGRAFVKIAYVEPKAKNFDLLDYEIKNFSALTENSSEIVDFINNFIQKRSIPERGVYLTLADTDLLVTRVLVLPDLPADEIIGAAKWQLKEDLPFDLDEAIIDYRLIKNYQTEQGAKKNVVMFFCVKREFIEKYLTLINKCNLSVVSVSTSASNYGNVLEILQPAEQVCAILDIGHTEATLCIYRDHNPYFIRILNFSSQKITQSLTGALISDKGRLELTLDEAEEIKRAFGIPLDEGSILKDNIKAIHIISMMRPFLEGLARELKLSFNYFTSIYKESQPQILYITGGGASLKNFGSYLSKELNLKVQELPLPDALKVEAAAKERVLKDKNQILSILGAVMGSVTAVNLLPEEIKGKRKAQLQNTLLRILGVVIGGIFLFSVFFLIIELKDYQKRVSTAKVHLQNIQKLKVIEDDIDVMDSLVNRIQQNRVPAWGLLKQISIIMPKGVVLSGLSLEQEKRNIVLRGQVQSGGLSAEAVLTDFMKTMERTPFFGESSLVYTQNAGGVQTFEIKCDITY